MTMLAQLGEKGVSIGARRTENEARSNGRLQGVCDVRFFVFHPKKLKTDFARKNAPNTIMSEAEKRTSKFQDQYVCRSICFTIVIRMLVF